MEMKKAFIKGTGFYAPEKVYTNKDLEDMVDTNDEWIVTRTGIRERHIAGEDETASTMGARAARMAIKDAGLANNDIDLIITNTITNNLPVIIVWCGGIGIVKKIINAAIQSSTSTT